LKGVEVVKTSFVKEFPILGGRLLKEVVL